MCSYNKTPVSLYDPTKLAIHSILHIKNMILKKNKFLKSTILKKKCSFKKHDFEKKCTQKIKFCLNSPRKMPKFWILPAISKSTISMKKNFKKHDFESKNFSKKQDFEWKRFCKKHEFDFKIFRFVRFWIKFFSSCQLPNKLFYNTSGFGFKKKRVRFWF